MTKPGTRNTEDARTAAKAAKAAYQREWCRKNPDKVRQYHENYWLRRSQREQAEGPNTL